MKHLCPYSNRECSVESLDECDCCSVRETFIKTYNDFPTPKTKTVLVSRIFDSSEELTEYVNSSDISKEDIQQIVTFTTCGFMKYQLFYWEKEYMKVSVNKNDDKEWIYAQEKYNRNRMATM